MSLELKVKTLPDQPGVYLYSDADGKIIYVGKAKSLKKRVSSYFNANLDNAKTRILVRQIKGLDFVVVETEFDALLLENNLIKKYQPRYNILLKDDKTYPWVCVKNEPFPRVFMTRKMQRDGSLYFGPYASVRSVRVVLALFKELFLLRTCKLDLSLPKIAQGKYKVCLENHIGNCKAPCIGEQTEGEYMQMITEVKQILRGNIKDVISLVREKMESASEEFRFEQAQEEKIKLEALTDYYSRSAVVSPSITNLDVFSILDDSNVCYINFLHVVNGSILQAYTTEVKKKLDETAKDILPSIIWELRNRFQSNSPELVLPFHLDIELPNLKVNVPQRGEKKKLLDLSEKNTKYYKLEQDKQRSILDPEQHSNRILERIKRDLMLDSLPRHIECFDNSNIQGSNPVAACVVFRNAKPFKKDYRHFNVKTVEGPDDFASMREIVFRRYRRLLDEKKDLPQLIVIDGGKGQLSAAVEALENLGLRGKIAIIGIAKKLEEIFFPDDSVPLYLDKTSESLKVIQHARNEAHRFGITFHRKKRSDAFITSELSLINGIGDKTLVQLYKEFKTINLIRSATEQAIADVIGKAKAKLIVEHFSKEEKGSISE